MFEGDIGIVHTRTHIGAGSRANGPRGRRIIPDPGRTRDYIPAGTMAIDGMVGIESGASDEVLGGTSGMGILA
jgi:hypothetical protein